MECHPLSASMEVEPQDANHGVCLYGLQPVRSLVIASPADQELHSRSPLMIAVMRKDPTYEELLFVLLGDVLRINLSRVEDKGSYKKAETDDAPTSRISRLDG